MRALDRTLRRSRPGRLALAGAVAATAAAVPVAVSGESSPAPKATTGASRVLTATSARVLGTVDPQGSPTTYRFRYGHTARYGMRTPRRPAGAAGALDVDARLEHLDPGVRYHYRLIATNEFGSVTGADRSFRTPAAQLAGRFATRVEILSGGRAFGQRRGDGGRRSYRFAPRCPGAAGEPSCSRVRLVREGRRGRFASTLTRRGPSRWSGRESFRGHCDDGLRFRSRTRIEIRARRALRARVERITGTLRTHARGCIAGRERSRLTGELR